jgi:cobalt-precorrin 5A hydrolase/precorrin-3B C17-methyltransferase
MNCAVENADLIREVSGTLLGGGIVPISSDFEISGEVPCGVELSSYAESSVSVTIRDEACAAPHEDACVNCEIDGMPAPRKKKAERKLRIIPRVACVGIGCRRGTPAEEIEDAVTEALRENGISPKALYALASIDLKAEEEGIKKLARKYKLPFLTYSAEELRDVPGEFTGSEFVLSVTGVDNVCERAAAAAGAHRILLGKTARDGMTICVGMRQVALSWDAEEEKSQTGKTLYVVGIGPGSRGGMTGEAESALAQSDTIVGYTVYNDLVKPFFPHKRYMTTPMTGEEKRCRMALEEAADGHTVALICSGDPGVYGMAGLVFTMAEEFPEVNVEVISGVTAATSGAALLGAPLIHDFAVISLSDRLTPWDKIERRLRAAAEADLCIVLYNPSSRGRKDHLHRAAQILIEQLPESRVCGIADRIGREGEKTRVLTLGELAEAETDMFSTVFVGNSSTRQLGNKMVTPRGYRSEKD